MNDDILVGVLIPACNRPCALAVTLTSLAAQGFTRFRIIISDQSDGEDACERPEIRAVLRYLQYKGRDTRALRHLQRRGMAEQRSFLLSQVGAPYCLFIDDDVISEPDLIERLYRQIAEQRCGFAGSALHGLSFIGDVRPHQQAIELWESNVEPESVAPGGHGPGIICTAPRTCCMCRKGWPSTDAPPGSTESRE